MKYKIIAEYERFYLTEHPSGYKECFNKVRYKPTEDGYIIKPTTYFIGNSNGLPPEKVNRSFNGSFMREK